MSDRYERSKQMREVTGPDFRRPDMNGLDMRRPDFTHAIWRYTNKVVF